MATTTSHNKKSSAVKRILSEAREFNESDTEFTANPLEDNIFEWHFTLRGPSSSEFEEGIYHGRILLPAEYPFRPPDVMLMTPNGRWELNKKICLTFTGFHEEMWQPAWGIRTALIGVQAFMAARAEAAVGVGSLDYPEEEREKLAKKSQDWTCPTCYRKNRDILSDNGVRKPEALPEGLTIDPRGGSKSGEASNNDEAQGSATKVPSITLQPEQEPLINQDSEETASDHGFGPSGPSDALLASIVDGQAMRDASLQNSSINSSCVTSGAATPIAGGSYSEKENNDKGKQRQSSEEDAKLLRSKEISAATSSSTSTFASSGTSLQRTASNSQQTSPPPFRVAPRVLPHSTAEPERRLAVLDRAIATVLFLLLALFLRRFLNAVS